MDDLDQKCKSLQSDLDTTMHQGKLREQELIQNIEDRDAAIGRLRAAIDTADKNAAMARESLQRTTEDALKDKSRVERLLSDSNNSNAMMKAQLEVLQARVVDLESDLVKSRDRCSQLEAQLTASRNTSLEMGRVNEQEKMTLESKMKHAVQDLEHTKRELERMRVALHTLETRNEAGEADRNSLHQRLVTWQSNLLAKERLETEKIRSQHSPHSSYSRTEVGGQDRETGSGSGKVLEYVVFEREAKFQSFHFCSCHSNSKNIFSFAIPECKHKIPRAAPNLMRKSCGNRKDRVERLERSDQETSAGSEERAYVGIRTGDRTKDTRGSTRCGRSWCSSQACGATTSIDRSR